MMDVVILLECLSTALPWLLLILFPAEKVERATLICDTLEGAKEADVLQFSLDSDEVDFRSFDYSTFSFVF